MTAFWMEVATLEESFWDWWLLPDDYSLALPLQEDFLP